MIEALALLAEMLAEFHLCGRQCRGQRLDHAAAAVHGLIVVACFT